MKLQGVDIAGIKKSVKILKMTPSALSAWVKGLIEAHPVFGVQARGDRFVFAPLRQAADLRLDYDVTVTPPKQFFQPACETLFRFENPVAAECLVGTAPFILLGVHPYDMAAINQMDKIFAEGNRDMHYQARRRQATILVCDVQAASPNGFAGCMGTATVADGHDLLLTRVGADYLVEPRTAKGQALLSGLKNVPEADPVSLARREQVWEDNRKYLRRHELKVNLKELPELLERSYDHPVWAEKAKRCFSCGSCNLVCPTCYCFDVQDQVNWDLHSGTRQRTWDGCMLKDFATVAGGHNFRKDRANRYRHRYYRKGSYVPAKIGEISCVGCGRCITACVTKIANPVEVYNRLQEPK